MKRLLYHIVFCCLAACSFTACEQEDMYRHTETIGDGNRIILDLASASLPVTREAVTATGVESAVSHLDVLIFNQDETKEWYERINIGKVGKITLSAKRSHFEPNKPYWVYLIANSTAKSAVFEVQDFNLTKLKGMTQEDERIHVTGLNIPNANAPQTFLMDGIAYQGATEPETATPVNLYDGNKSADTELKVTLRRAAAKIVVNISHGKDVEFGDNPRPGATGYGYYLRNMPYSTSVIPPQGIDAETAKLRTPDKYNGPYFFNWTAEKITVTTYAYAHVWKNASTLEKEVRLIVNIPMLYTPHDEVGNSTKKPEYFNNSYYQIPVSKVQKLDRNTCYQVNVTVNAPGGSDPSKPLPLTDINYSVYDWENKQINIGGETDLPAYLTLNKYEMEMHNMAEDNTTLEFASSSEVTANITRVYYIDKFGQEKELTRITNGKPDEWGEKTGSNYNPNWKNRCTIKTTPDKNINGKIHVHGDIPENKTIRYIEFTLTNKENITRTIKVAQYPLEYIINIQSWYSYRDDFKKNDPKATTYEYKGDRVYGISLATRNISTWNGKYNYEVSSRSIFEDENTNSGFFRSKVVTNVDNGKSDIDHYYWGSKGRLSTFSSGEYNGRLYRITLTATSEKYTIGQPRLIEDKDNPGLMVTDPGKDNAELVSPSFMIASSLGGFMLGSGNLTLDDSSNSLRVAREHCANYVEVYKDNNGKTVILDDWRLPTKSELQIVMEFQGEEKQDADAIDYLLNAQYYYSASGRVENSKKNMKGTGVRCIRDAYDKNTGK